MLGDVGPDGCARRVQFRRRHLTIEIAIEPQQQIDGVQRQPEDGVNRTAVDRELRVADTRRLRRSDRE